MKALFTTDEVADLGDWLNAARQMMEDVYNDEASVPKKRDEAEGVATILEKVAARLRAEVT